MNAVPSDLLRQTAELSESVTRPIPGSRKIHVEGSRQDLRVPMREIALADTPSLFGAEKNAPFTVYDTSGPYTDPAYAVDLAAGLPGLRARWIDERGDSERLADFTSPFTRRHAVAPSLADVRFPDIPKPRVAKSGMNVSQMHYARRGLRCRPGKRSSSRLLSAARWRPNSDDRPGSCSVSARSSIHCWRSAGRPERMSIFAAGSE